MVLPFQSSSSWLSFSRGCWIKWPLWIFWCYILQYLILLYPNNIYRYFSHSLQCLTILNIMPHRLTKLTKWDVISLLIFIKHCTVLCRMPPSLTYFTPLHVIPPQLIYISYFDVPFHHWTFISMVSFNPTCSTPYFLPFLFSFS